MEENKDLSTPAEETSAEASTSVDQPDMAPISEETTAPKSETETSDKEEVETSRTETENKPEAADDIQKNPQKVVLDESILTKDLEAVSSPDELAELAALCMNFEPKKALKRLNQIRSRVGEVLREQKKLALEQWIQDGNDVQEFIQEESSALKNINSLLETARAAREEEKARLEREKVANFKRKQELLENLKSLVQRDETEATLQEVKDIQKEWSAIRLIPKDKENELWEEYNYLLNTFYDNHGINIELKELDRKKNLETKIDLCKKVDELSQMHSIKRSFILLNKYRDEFRNTGPVPRAFNKDIWDRFNAACDKIYEAKKGELAKLDEEKNANLEKKTILVEKAGLISAVSYDKTKVWNAKTKDMEKLMDSWKAIGPVPKSDNERIWKEFRGNFDTFYTNKSAYFKELNAQYKANLILKEDIIKQAGSLLENPDLDFGTGEIIKLQKEWKKIGPVSPKVSNPVWKKFRGICDDFFAKKDASRADQIAEEKENLEKKQNLINRLKGFLEEEPKEDLAKEMRAIEKEWRSIGFVPFKEKKKIEKAFEKAADAVFEKFKIEKKDYQEERAEEHYKDLATMPGGLKRLKDEEFKIKKKLTFLNGEISTLQNNIEFFGRSSSAQKLKQDIEKKIETMQKQIGRLKGQLKAIKLAKTVSSEKTNAAE
jgi:flagellin-specific chaperone FliS